MMKVLQIKVISRQPPGGRCQLYAQYARVLANPLHLRFTLHYSENPDTHGNGYPSLIIHETAIQPADGVILMPDEILAALLAQGMSIPESKVLLEALYDPLNRLLNDAG